MTHVEKVQHIYQAFGRGEVPAILALLGEQVEWEYGVNATDVPWLQTRRGRDGAAEFFQAVAGLEITRFDVKALLASGDIVVALIDLEATVRATGRRVSEEDEVHLWHFGGDGLVSRFRHRADTHQHWVAFHGASKE